MPTYRVYFLDAGAHISGPAIILECSNDEEAKRKARQYIGSQEIELWRENTLIALFPKR